MNIVGHEGRRSERFTIVENKWITWLAAMATAGIGYFFVAVAWLHFLRPDYDPVRRVISNYAVGRYGVLMTVAFLALALSFFSLALGFYQALSTFARSRLASILLAIAGLGMVLSSTFPTDTTPDDSPRTMVGTIHIFAGVMSFVCLVVVSLLLANRFRRDAGWHSFRRPAWALALGSLSAFAIFFFVKAANLPFGGIAQRFFLTLILLWFLFAALRLRNAVSNSKAN